MQVAEWRPTSGITCDFNGSQYLALTRHTEVGGPFYLGRNDICKAIRFFAVCLQLINQFRKRWRRNQFKYVYSLAKAAWTRKIIRTTSDIFSFLVEISLTSSDNRSNWTEFLGTRFWNCGKLQLGHVTEEITIHSLFFFNFSFRNLSNVTCSYFPKEPVVIIILMRRRIVFVSITYKNHLPKRMLLVLFSDFYFRD